MVRLELGLALAAILFIGLFVAAGGTMSGFASLEAKLAITEPDWLDALDLDMGIAYSAGGVFFSSNSLIVLPGMLVWQGFSGGATIGAYSFEVDALFSGTLTDHLYTEAIVGLSIGGIDMTFYAAQLGDAVLGGPSDGWAVRIAGSLGGAAVVSTTEFGAQIEDDEYQGITIVHAPTGRMVHYATDPRPPGSGFSGEKIVLDGFSLCSADIDITTYFSCADGLEYVKIGAAGIEIEPMPVAAIDVDLTFSVEEKTLAFDSDLSVGEVLCFTVYSAIVFDSADAVEIAGYKLVGLDLSGEFGPVTLRDVAIFDPYEFALTTEEFGSRVTAIDDILDAGYDYYPDYWEMLSLAYRGPGCCEGESTLLFNVYFERDGVQIFDLALFYLEVNVPIRDTLSLSIGSRMTLPDIDWIKLGLAFSF